MIALEMQAVSASLLAVSLGLLGCGAGTMPPSVGHSFLGNAAPEFHEMATSDRDVGLPGSPRTRVTVVDFWASWCAGCRDSIPALNDLYNDKREDGVMVIGVSVDESPDDALLLAQHLHAKYPIVLDPHMRLAGSYRVGNIPLTFVVDRHGIVRWIGRDPGDVRRAVNVVLSE
jgi:cytochrome c biogenesis protein CcmG/thiol:disulfide interchange protein DsbE